MFLFEYTRVTLGESSQSAKRIKTEKKLTRSKIGAILDQKNLTGLAGGVREGPNIAKYGPRFWLLSPLEAPKWVKDSGNGPQMGSKAENVHKGGPFWAIF